MSTTPPPPPPGGPGQFGGPPPGGPGGYAYGGYGQAPMGPVNNHMVWAVLTTLFCCLPFGIVAIVKASQVSSKLAMGDYAGAVAASNQAKTWSIVSMVIGLVVGVIYFVVIVGIGAAAGSGY